MTERILAVLGQDWSYQFFSNGEQQQYLSQQCIDGMPNLVGAWKSMHLGHHASDLFRYIYLWQHGGIYLDLDAMIYDDLTQWVDHADFMTAQSGPHKMLPGFIGCRANSELMWQLALDAYHADRHQLKSNYGLLCENLNRLVHAYTGPEHVMLLEENVDDQLGQGMLHDPVTGRGPIMIHYFRDKVIL
jgi:hypothetical protein